MEISDLAAANRIYDADLERRFVALQTRGG